MGTGSCRPSRAATCTEPSCSGCQQYNPAAAAANDWR